MSEFKQIIGRGTRVRDDYDKLWFNIIDYTGSATRMFADPDFDGDPVKLTEEELLKSGETRVLTEEPRKDVAEPEVSHIIEPPEEDRRKYYFDGGSVEIAAHLVHELDPDGKQLRVVRYTDYAAEKVRTLCPTASELHKKWSDPTQRFEIIQALEEKGVSFAELAEQAKMPEADPFDLLCHLAFNAPLRTRRERAQRLKSERKGFFEQYGPEAARFGGAFGKIRGARQCPIRPAGRVTRPAHLNARHGARNQRGFRWHRETPASRARFAKPAVRRILKTR